AGGEDQHRQRRREEDPGDAHAALGERKPTHPPRLGRRSLVAGIRGCRPHHVLTAFLTGSPQRVVRRSRPIRPSSAARFSAALPLPLNVACTASQTAFETWL